MMYEMPIIVCICGSGRFLKEMHEVEERLTLEGKIVLMIGVNTKDVARTQDLEHYKPMLDELHLRKIDLSDYVYIVNVGGYIRESTTREIEYTKVQNKEIEYLYDNNSIITPEIGAKEGTSNASKNVFNRNPNGVTRTPQKFKKT